MIIKQWPYSEIIFVKVKWLRWDEPIPLLKPHNNLDYWTTPHFSTSDKWLSKWMYKRMKKLLLDFIIVGFLFHLCNIDICFFACLGLRLLHNKQQYIKFNIIVSNLTKLYNIACVFLILYFPNTTIIFFEKNLTLYIQLDLNGFKHHKKGQITQE
jgi:hypothetical protein